MPQPEAIDPTADKTPKFDFAVLDNAEPPRSIVYEIESDRPVLILGIQPTHQLAVEQIASILNQNDVGSVMLFATNQERRSALDDLINDAIEQWHEGDSPKGLHAYLGWSLEEYSAWVEGRRLPKALRRLAEPQPADGEDPNAEFIERAAQAARAAAEKPYAHPEGIADEVRKALGGSTPKTNSPPTG